MEIKITMRYLAPGRTVIIAKTKTTVHVSGDVEKQEPCALLIAMKPVQGVFKSLKVRTPLSHSYLTSRFIPKGIKINKANSYPHSYIYCGTIVHNHSNVKPTKVTISG